MHRNLDEVIASQRAMLARLERPGGRLDERLLARTYTKQLVQVQTWLQRRPEIHVLAINYADAVGAPGGTSARLARFLGEPFDEAAATAAVDHSLQRKDRGLPGRVRRPCERYRIMLPVPTRIAVSTLRPGCRCQARERDRTLRGRRRLSTCRSAAAIRRDDP